jgi:hypothetical protein
MANVLKMAAFEQGAPMAFVIGLIADNLSFH